MRKLIQYSLVVLFLLCCFGRAANAQITGHTTTFNAATTCNGVSAVVNTPQFPDTSYHIETNWGDLSKTTTIVAAHSTSTNTSHLYAYPGTYTIKHVLKSANQRIDSISYSYQYRACQTVQIKSFYDANTNCNFDAPQDFYVMLPITIQIDSANVPIDTIKVSSSFYYPIYGPVGTIYQFKVIGTTPGTQITCPANGILTDTVSNIVNDYSVKSFGISDDVTGGIFDLTENVSVQVGTHHAHAHILITNNYCGIQNANLTLNFSPRYNFQMASNSPTVNGSTLTWNLGNLPLLTPVNLSADFEVLFPNPHLSPGDTVHSSYYLTPTLGDSNLLNNIIIHDDTVVSSFDPNYIDVMPKGNITAGTKLTYSIEFENTGNDTATNIYILDTLPGNLNAKTLDIVNSSAIMDFSLNKIASGQYVAKFDFPNINLLDSTHHGECTGMVVYTIDSRSDLPFGTYIPNRAGIYFDDNEVVMTNTAVNKIGIPQSVTTIGNTSSATLYPNPVTDILTINTNAQAYNSLEINNTIGQLLIKQKVTQADTKVNVKSLPAGIYTITLKGNGGTKTLKFEKL